MVQDIVSMQRMGLGIVRVSFKGYFRVRNEDFSILIRVKVCF